MGGGEVKFSGSPLKLYFQIPCIFPVFVPLPPQIVPVPIYMICDYYIHKTDLADISTAASSNKLEIFATNITISFSFESGNLQLEQTKFPVF